MRETLCLLVALDAASFATAQKAAHSVFSKALIQSFTTLDEALKCESTPADQFLVIGNPTKSDLAKAREATDSSGLSRWAIIALGASPAVEGVEMIALEDWKEPVLARAFRCAMAQQQLIRENQRLRGDLQTIAHRIIHDLRTPIGGILTAGEALDEALAEHDANSKEMARPLFQSVDELKKLVEHLSALSKATAEPVPKESVSMQEVVWMVLQRTERHRLKKGSVIIQPAPWPEVDGVFSWLETIWWELLNVLQPGKDSILVELGWNDEPQAWCFWVRSHGADTPPAKVATLFQPFHLLDQSSARSDLGLSVVQRLVELQGGRCGNDHHSEDGERLYFTLPNTAEKTGCRPATA